MIWRKARLRQMNLMRHRHLPHLQAGARCRDRRQIISLRAGDQCWHRRRVPRLADVGSLVVADAMVAADLGSQTPDGFLWTSSDSARPVWRRTRCLPHACAMSCSGQGSLSAALRSPCPRRPEPHRRPRSCCAACRMLPPKAWKASA